MENSPIASKYTSSNSSWMEESQITEWFQSLLLPDTESLRKVKSVMMIMVTRQCNSSVDSVQLQPSTIVTGLVEYK